MLRRIAPASIEDTGGYFIATPDDPDDYVEAFADNCNASGVDCDEVKVADLLAREPALNPKTRRAFRVPDGSIEPWMLIDSMLADARRHGSEALTYQRVIGMEVQGNRITEVALRDEQTGTVSRVWTKFVVSAAGAWAGQIAAFANVSVEMTPGKGTMLIYNHRMTDAVINRCHRSSDGDIMVPVHTVAILGTTDIKVPDPDDYEVTRAEVERLVSEGAKMFPDLPRMRILRAYAGVRPLYQPPADAVPGVGNRSISRAHAILDHADQGVDNFVSIVGGKLTTHRLMAEQTVDVVAAKMGITDAVHHGRRDAPRPGDRPHLLAGPPPRGSRGGGRRRRQPPVRVRAGRAGSWSTRTSTGTGRATSTTSGAGAASGMGPCQGAFCMFRVAGLLAERLDARTAATGQPAPGALEVDGYGPGTPALHAAIADRALTGFFRERFKGTRPIAEGRQLQELMMTNGVYLGVLGLESMTSAPAPTLSEESLDAAR